MKPNIYFLTLIILFTHTLTAQIEQGTHLDHSRINFGIKGSIGLMKYHINTSTNQLKIDSPYSLYTALYGVMNYRIKDFILLYTHTGLAFSDNTIDIYYNDIHKSISHTSFFLDTPLGIKFYGSRAINLRPTCEITIGHLYLFNEHIEDNEDITFNLCKNYVYLSSSIGLDIYTPHIKISPSIGYTYGLGIKSSHIPPDTSFHMTKNMYISRMFFSIIFR